MEKIDLFDLVNKCINDIKQKTGNDYNLKLPTLYLYRDVCTIKINIGIDYNYLETSLQLLDKNSSVLFVPNIKIKKAINKLDKHNIFTFDELSNPNFLLDRSLFVQSNILIIISEYSKFTNQLETKLYNMLIQKQLKTNPIFIMLG